MTGEAEPQNEYDENGLPGPGAPTPLSSLEVRYGLPPNVYIVHSGETIGLTCGFNAGRVLLG